MQGTSEDEDDDFLKGETPQNDGVVGIAPNSYESTIQSPDGSIGSPPDCYVPYPPWQRAPEMKRLKIVCNFLLCRETFQTGKCLSNYI